MESSYKVDKLGNYIEQIRGISYKPHDISEEPKEGYKVVLRANSIKDNKLILNDLIYVKDELIKEKQLIKRNDILMAASSGSKEIVGKCVQIKNDTEYTFGAFCKLIRCIGNINADYVAYFFRTPYYRATISSVVNGANINNLKNEHIDDLLIPLPSNEVQNKIVEILDKSQELIDKRKEQIKYLDELVKSRFIEMFGDPVTNPMNWEKRTLNEVSLRKGEYGSGASAIEYIKDYPRYIRITDINDSGKLNNNKVTIENLSEYEKYKLNDGDILFARTGATVGKTFRYRKSDGECLFAGYLIRFIPNMDIINPDFLFAFTKTSFYQGWVDAKQNTVAQPNINAKQYGEELEVILPPIELQNQFADFVKQVDKLKFEMEKSLKELEDNFNSLMQKAFKGELF